MKNTHYLIVSVLFLTSCRGDYLYIYPPNKDKCITIITEKNIRYIMHGKHREVTNENYLKLDISKTTDLSDAIYICWPKSGLPGEILIPKTTIIENKLDSTLYIFKNELPIDEVGFPTPEKYSNDGCTAVGFSYKNPFPKGSSIVEDDYN